MNYLDKARENRENITLSAEELKKQLKEAGALLYEQQMKIKEKKLPIVILMEGWGTSGKGDLIGKIIQNIDPRFFKVWAMNPPTDEEKRKPFISRYFEKIPKEGQFVFFDTGWMDEITRDVLDNNLSKSEYAHRISSIKNFERTLIDNGYLVIKIFCHISEKEQKSRIGVLKSGKDTGWRVDEYDLWQNEHYEKCKKVFNKYMEDTGTEQAPWYIIDSKKRKMARLRCLEIINRSIAAAMKGTVMIDDDLVCCKEAGTGGYEMPALVKMPNLADIKLKDKTLTDEQYDKKLEQLQSRLKELHNRLYRKKVPVIIAYEGWDAAGKGGNIKRITGALDPRGFEVIPVSSPQPEEKSRHYLWRFWTRLPKDGHIAIFDRTWYGRVMVERIEGFCSENDWKRAYREINEFEKELRDWGAIIIKFWVQIDKDTQLERFNDRQNDPARQWKITDEDWRNREKWDVYETAVNEMLKKTSTEYAPWYVLESVDKKYARIKALEVVIDRLEKILK